MTTTTVDMQDLKSRLKTTWATGDYDAIAEGLNRSAEAFIGRIPLEPRERLLDVACGTGQVSIPAARTGARVIGVDIAPNQIARARERAIAAGVDVHFEEGDVEALRFQDDTFHVVTSLIGAMFAPRPEIVASELLRVCRPGGRVVMGNWTPAGFVGRMFETIAAHVPPPAMPSPVLWGDVGVASERLARGSAAVTITARTHVFRYDASPEEVVDLYARCYGPINRALAALDDVGRAALRGDLLELWSEWNVATGGTTRVSGELIEVIAVKA